MARCVSLQHSPRLSAASAIAFHDESILALLQDPSRDLFPSAVRGISASSWDNAKKVQLTLAGLESCSLRQVNIKNEGTKESIYFLGAALVPPLDPKIATVKIVDDFGVCMTESRGEAQCDSMYAFGGVQEKMTVLGKVACHLGPNTGYYVSISCQLTSKPKAPSSRRHLLVLAFHDSMAGSNQQNGTVSNHLDDCFHLFIGVHIDMAIGLHAAPLLNQLRHAAPPFFPEHLHRLFDTPPQWFLIANPKPDDASFSGFIQRQHVPAYFTLPCQPKKIPQETPMSCSDGCPPTVTPESVQALMAAADEEDKAMRIGITHFDMFQASMVAVASLPVGVRRKYGIRDDRDVVNLYKLEVPGLHEGKPPVYRGDAVHLRIDGCELMYELCCCAVSVSYSDLIIQLPDNLPFPSQATYRVHVRFSIDFGRINAMRQAASLLLNSPHWSFFGLNIPEPPHGGLSEWRVQDDVTQFPARAGRWFGALNEQQRYVVEAVHAMPKGSPPFLLVGPPGTGKSWAIAETVCQFMFCHVERLVQEGAPFPHAKILLCAPTEIACDLLVETVQQHLQPASSSDVVSPTGLMLRYNEPQRPLQHLFNRTAVYAYCCIDQSTGTFAYPGHDAVDDAVVVVCTLRAAWSLQSYMLGSKIAFDYILIDEAGQALELELYAALSLGNHDARVLLAGDPKQLGPTCRAAQHCHDDPVTKELVGLMRVSLLERLCYRHPRWTPLDSPWVVRLYRNYRSHPVILDLLSSTRYDGSLVAQADEMLVRKFENLNVLPVKGFPMAFIGVRGQQQMDVSNENQYCLSRPDVAHSYHNPEEALVVVQLVNNLLMHREDIDPQVVQNDIGIVCSFRRQVQKVRGLLRAEGFGSVRVGTVEDYQGQQERILIISTALTDPSKVSTLQQLDADAVLPVPVPEVKPKKNNKIKQADHTNARTKIMDALEVCIRSRVQKDEAWNGQLPGADRQTENLVGSARRFTVALSRAQCILIVVGCPDVLETSPHWRRFLLYVAAHGAIQGATLSNSLMPLAGVANGGAHSTEVRVGEDSEKKQPCQQPCQDIQSAAGMKLLSANLEVQIKRWQACAQESEALVERYASEISSIGSELRRSRAARDDAVQRVTELERRLQEETDDKLCVVCAAEPKVVALFPCGHVPLCRNCEPLLYQKESPQCPNCRTLVESSYCLFL